MKYKFNPNFRYIVDIYDIKLINADFEKTIVLKYPEAAIFDFLQRSYEKKRIVSMLSKLGHYNQSHATQLLDDSLKYFLENSILIEIK